MMKSIFTVIGFLFTFSLIAQNQVNLIANWDYKRKTTHEKINKVITSTNGYIIAVGKTIGASYEDTDGLFMVLEARTGQRQVWKKIGGNDDQAFHSVVQNPDGTFTLVGFSRSSSQDLKRGWIVEVDIAGNIISEHKTRETAGDQDLTDAAANAEGTTVMIGNSFDGKIERPMIMAMDESGGLQIVPVELDGINELKGIQPTEDNQFVVLANTKAKNHRHPEQIVVFKFDQEGNLAWGGPKFFGKKGTLEGSAINHSEIAGGFIIAGTRKNRDTNGASDICLIKIDASGELEWEKGFGGMAADVASSVLELSEGGYAVLSHTWSYLVRARHSVMQLFVVDEKGNPIDQDTYPIIDAEGNEIGCALTESSLSDDLILSGNSVPEKKHSLPVTHLGAVTYNSTTELEPLEIGEERFGNSIGRAVQVSNSYFVDENENHYLEADERGFVAVQITNGGKQTITNITAKVHSNHRKDVQFWSSVYVGALRAGQTKTISIPVRAGKALSLNAYNLDINLHSKSGLLASSKVQVPSNRVSPANLIVNRFSFSPEQKAKAGEILQLKIELTNIGGKNTNLVEADFNLPAGVLSQNSERVQIPSLAPNEKIEVTLPFYYTANFGDRMIHIGFETSSTEGMVGIKKSFEYMLEQTLVAVQPTAKPVSDLILWTSHETDAYRTIPVTKEILNVKAIAISDSQLDKKNFSILINGKRIQGQKLDESKLSPPNHQPGNRIQQTYSNQIQLEEGENEVRIIYQDGGKNLESLPLKFHFTPMDKPNLHVLSIGVQHSDLAYTVNDATAMTELYMKLKDEKGRGFRKVNIYPLLKKEETTKLNIQKAFLNLKNSKSIKDNDLVIVFISSHGKVVEGDRYVLLPSDYDAQYEDLTTVDFNEDILKRLRAVDGNKLVFIDACHSGSAGARSFSDRAASKLMNDLIEATSGMEIFASCGNNEYSYEDQSWKNGAFTKAIIEAFNNVAVELNGEKVQADMYTEVNGKKEKGSDGVITIEELKSYVQKRVPYLVKTVKGKEQNPTNKTTDLLPRDMGIYMVN